MLNHNKYTKMKQVILASILLSTIVLNGCKKENTSEKQATTEYNPITNAVSGVSQFKGMFTLLSQCSYTPSNPTSKSHTYSFEGRIVNSSIGALNAVALDAGLVKLNGTSINKNSSFIYGDYALNGASYYGSQVNFEVTGNASNGINAATCSLYAPTQIYMSNPSSLMLSKSGSNIISWNPDPNYSGDVYVSVIYKGAQSHDKDPSLPTTDIVYSAKTTDANGSYTIPASAIASMPINGIIEITIGRGNYTTINTGNGNNLVCAATITYNNFTLNQ